LLETPASSCYAVCRCRIIGVSKAERLSCKGRGNQYNEKTQQNASPPPNQSAANCAAELARKICLLDWTKEKLITDVPGLLLSRRTAPTAPASATYEPSLAVVGQGRKQQTWADTTFIFDESDTC